MFFTISQTTLKSIKAKLPDISGVCLSSLCILHCVVLPLLPGLLVSLDFDNHLFHWSVIIASLPITGFAAYTGYKRHKNRWISFTLMLAWAMLATTEFLPEKHDSHLSWLPVSAGALIITTHYFNIKKKNRCVC